MPFALHSGIIVATIRAPCGDCNWYGLISWSSILLQFAPLAGTVTTVRTINTFSNATIRAPCGDCNKWQEALDAFIALQFAPLAGTVT